jgi:hypothetical protein
MLVTDDGYTSKFKASTGSKNPNLILNAEYSKASADKSIAWVESHDEYVSSNTRMGESRVAKFWGVLTSRKDLGTLYLGRPDENIKVGTIGSYQFEHEWVACANRFHNRFVGADEYQSADGKVYINERISSTDQGAYVLNLDTIDETKEVTVTLPHLDDGNYYDTLTGNKVVVHNHKASMKFDINGMAFLTRTNQKARPRFKINIRNCSFVDDKQITIDIDKYDEAFYTFNDETTKYPLNKETKISIKDHVVDNKVKLNITLKNGTHEVKRTFIYNKVKLIEGYFNVININPNYLTDYDLYMWSWSPSVWSKNYIVQDDVLLVDTTGMTGFLFAIFEKGYKINDLTKWDSNNIKQSADIKGSLLDEGFYDASSF